jgi:6-phosphofructokinase 1
MKLGVCTGGGDCPGLNAAIRAVTEHGIGTYGFEFVGIQDSFNGLLETIPKVMPVNLDVVSDILARGGTILGTENRNNPFKDPKRKDAAIAKIHQSIKNLGLEGLIVIGGEGTQSMAATLVESGINIIGIPKTIDNDLPGSDYTIGFATAVDIVAEALTRLKSTAESHDRIMVLEVMGRDSGYIALYGGLAGGAHGILIPEIPFQLDILCQKIKVRQTMGRNHSLIVVAEGARSEGGEQIFRKDAVHGHNLGGIAYEVAELLSQKTNMETRVTVLGHVQRGGAPNASDRILATRLGVKAVNLFADKNFGRCVVYKGGLIKDHPYRDYLKGRRSPVSLESDVLNAAESIGICLGR